MVKAEIYRREEALFDRQIIRYGINVANHQTLLLKKDVYLRLGGYRIRTSRIVATTNTLCG